MESDAIDLSGGIEGLRPLGRAFSVGDVPGRTGLSAPSLALVGQLCLVRESSRPPIICESRPCP